MELEAAKKALTALAPPLEQKREVIEMLKGDYPINLLWRLAGCLAQQLLLSADRD